MDCGCIDQMGSLRQDGSRTVRDFVVLLGMTYHWRLTSCLFLEFFRLIFSDYGKPWVIEISRQLGTTSDSLGQPWKSKNMLGGRFLLNSSADLLRHSLHAVSWDHFKRTVQLALVNFQREVSQHRLRPFPSPGQSLPSTLCLLLPPSSPHLLCLRGLASSRQSIEMELGLW